MGKPIHAFHVGDYEGDQIIVAGAIHAREWITALLVVGLAELEASKVNSNGKCGGIWFIPLCNPDGVEIALSTDPLWKANSRGVDLNVNFDADWGTGIQNVTIRGSENYIGAYPNSEPEVKTLIDFTREVAPKVAIAYHSKGELVYFRDEHSRDLANIVGDVTGYEPRKTVGSAGGYCDWVSMHMGIPALTIEVGNDDYDHPIGVDKLPEIFAQNKDVLSVVANHIAQCVGH